MAANRTHKVNGRIKILVVSIKMSAGFNQSGAPPGKRCAATLEGLVITPEMINPSHIGSPNLKVKTKCEENLKIYGINPKRFTEIRKINSGVIMEFNPFKWNPNVVLIWEDIKLVGKDRSQKIWLGITQYEAFRVTITIILKSQNNLEEVWNNEFVAGSKEEKISTIISRHRKILLSTLKADSLVNLMP